MPAISALAKAAGRNVNPAREFGFARDTAGITSLPPGARDTLLRPRGTPTGPLMPHGPAAGCPACWGATEHAQIQTHPSPPMILGRFPGKEGCPSALGVAPHQGGVALGTPTAPPALFLHQFLQFFPILLGVPALPLCSSGCRAPAPAHSPQLILLERQRILHPTVAIMSQTSLWS